MNHMNNQYKRLGVMAALSFVAMYALMYAMVDTLGNVYVNVNQFYMAGLMTAAMIIIELLCMGVMYVNKKKNFIIVAVSFVVLTASWIGIRQQLFVNDKQFLLSMIPHHASALLMCANAPVSDLEIHALCDSILAGQQDEISQMKNILSRMR